MGAALMLGGLAYDGIRRTPTGPADGVALNGATAVCARESDHIRVATWNIDGGCGLDGRRDLGRTANCLRGFDLIGLNEVHGATIVGRRDQAEELGEQLGLPWLFAPTERRWWHDDFGNGLLTWMPVLHWQRFPLSAARVDANRNVLMARVRVGSRVVNVLCTHLSRHAGQEAELRAVAELFLSLGEPAILMGDLNAADDSPAIRRLLDTPGVVDAIDTCPAGRAHAHVDWIFAHGLRCMAAGVREPGPSDHALYWAEFEADQGPAGEKPDVTDRRHE